VTKTDTTNVLESSNRGIIDIHKRVIK